MREISKTTGIPENSAILDGFGKEVHYHDTYRIAAKTTKPAAEVAKELMTLPKWVTALMKLRHAIVGIFGLKVGKADARFPVISQTEDEVVSGLPDKHLDFRVSIMTDSAADTVSLTTVVHFNNIWGRVYFLPVRPFHKLIMRALMRRYSRL